MASADPRHQKVSASFSGTQIARFLRNARSDACLISFSCFICSGSTAYFLSANVTSSKSRRLVKAKLHYASLFGAGSELVRS